MIKMAYHYKDQVYKLFRDNALTRKTFWLNLSSYMDMEQVKLEQLTWAKMQMVSVYDNKVKGYMEATLKRETNAVEDIMLVNFNNSKTKYIKEAISFIWLMLNEFNFSKIKFRAVVGSPTENMYRKFIEIFDGCVVGTFENDVRLRDGHLYDVTYFELKKSNFVDAVKNKADAARWNKICLETIAASMGIEHV